MFCDELKFQIRVVRATRVRIQRSAVVPPGINLTCTHALPGLSGTKHLFDLLTQYARKHRLAEL